MSLRDAMHRGRCHPQWLSRAAVDGARLAGCPAVDAVGGCDLRPTSQAYRASACSGCPFTPRRSSQWPHLCHGTTPDKITRCGCSTSEALLRPPSCRTSPLVRGGGLGQESQVARYVPPVHLRHGTEAAGQAPLNYCATRPDPTTRTSAADDHPRVT